MFIISDNIAETLCLLNMNMTQNFDMLHNDIYTNVRVQPLIFM